MDRRQRKLEKNKKKRQIANKRARADATQKPTPEQRALALGARSPFGRCAISLGWKDEESLPELVTAVVTRALPDGTLLPVIALVDRTCLGVKNAFVAPPLAASDLEALLDEIGRPHGGWEASEPLVVQSLVFNAIDYARRLGFEPHPDFPAELFGPRPPELQKTPWHAAARPFCVASPDDDVVRIRARLTAAVGEGNFDLITRSALLPADDADEDADADDLQLNA